MSEGHGGSMDDANFKAPEKVANVAPRGALEIANGLAQLLVDRNHGAIDIAAAKDLLDKNVAIVETTVSNVALQEEVNIEKPLSPSISEPGLSETRKKALPPIQRLTEPERVVAAEYLVIALLSQDPQNAELVKQLRATYEADAKNATIHPTIFGKWRPKADARIGEEIARTELIIDGLINGPSTESAAIGFDAVPIKDDSEPDYDVGTKKTARMNDLTDQSVKNGGRQITYATDPAISTGNYLAQNQPFAEQVATNIGQLRAAIAGKK